MPRHLLDVWVSRDGEGRDCYAACVYDTRTGERAWESDGGTAYSDLPALVDEAIAAMDKLNTQEQDR